MFLAKISDHVQVDAPAGVFVFLGSSGTINVVRPPEWWAEIKPEPIKDRADGIARWAMAIYRGIVTVKEYACCEWDVLTWLSKIWRAV